MAKQRLFPMVVTAGSLLATTAPFHLAGVVTAAAAPTGATAVVNGLGKFTERHRLPFVLRHSTFGLHFSIPSSSFMPC